MSPSTVRRLTLCRRSTHGYTPRGCVCAARVAGELCTRYPHTTNRRARDDLCCLGFFSHVMEGNECRPTGDLRCLPIRTKFLWEGLFKRHAPLVCVCNTRRNKMSQRSMLMLAAAALCVAGTQAVSTPSHSLRSRRGTHIFRTLHRPFFCCCVPGDVLERSLLRIERGGGALRPST